jgi:hypothetical protein
MLIAIQRMMHCGLRHRMALFQVQAVIFEPLLSLISMKRYTAQVAYLVCTVKNHPYHDVYLSTDRKTRQRN